MSFQGEHMSEVDKKEGIGDPKKKVNTVLVIEDEIQVQGLVKTILETLGYDVIMVGKGNEGLSTFSKSSGDIDLVLLDLDLPDMNGKDILRELIKIKSDVSVVISSGSLPDIKDYEGAKGIVKKPFDLLQFMGTINNAIV